MPWEQRGQQRYFYKTRRINGKVVKEYFGKGPLAYAMEELTKTQKATRDAQRKRIADAKQQTSIADEYVEQLHKAAEVVAAAQVVHPAPDPAIPEESKMVQFDSSDAIISRLRQLLALRAEGKLEVEQELCQIMDQFPQLWEQFGDLGELAQGFWVEMIGGNDHLLKQGIRRKLKSLQAEFSVGVQDPASRLLVERVILTWIQVTHADIRYADTLHVDEKFRAFLARRQTQAQQQHLAAIRAWRQWQNLGASTPNQGMPPRDTAKSYDSKEDKPNVLLFPLPRIKYA